MYNTLCETRSGIFVGVPKDVWQAYGINETEKEKNKKTEF